MLSAFPLRPIAGSALLLLMTLGGLKPTGDQDPVRPAADAGPTAKAAAPDSSILPSMVPREFSKTLLPEYVVEPPDMIVVEVLETLPGRPITGERLVRPDGRMSLGFYGDIYVAGLTTAEIKAKIVVELRKFLSASALGLEIVKEGQTMAVSPYRTTKVFVDVVAYNSKLYYVQGDVVTPQRLPITGNETVLDAFSYAEGPKDRAAQLEIRLARPGIPGKSRDLILPVDLRAITDRADSTTNYQMMPGDRLIVRQVETPSRPAGKAEHPQATGEQEARLQAIERKLELILQKMGATEKE